MPSGFPHVRHIQSLVAKHDPRGIVVRRLGECFLPCPDIKDREGAVENRKNSEVVFVIQNPKLYFIN